MREEIARALKDAMKSRDALRTGTLRMVSAAIKDRDILARGEGSERADDAALAAVLSKMIRQREESAKAFEATRPELAAKERAEIEMIRAFLPQQMSDAEMEKAVKAAIAEVGAASVRDMGKVMALLKSRHAGEMDFGKASATAKALLG